MADQGNRWGLLDGVAVKYYVIGNSILTTTKLAEIVTYVGWSFRAIGKVTAPLMSTGAQLKPYKKAVVRSQDKGDEFQLEKKS